MTVIKSRRGTAAEWTSADPVLADGEKGFERDTNKFKIGDGTTAWASLPYFIDEDAVAALIPAGGSLAGYYDVVADGGCAGNGTTDDTTNFAASVVTARVAGQALYVPPTATIRLTSQVDMRGNYDIASYGRLFIDQTATPGILIGHNAGNSMPRSIYLRQVDHASDSTTVPSIRVIGLKNAGHVVINDTDYLQLWADGDTPADSSVAYNSFRLGACNKLHITSIGTMGWINENSFYGGRIGTILIDGLYPHNHNLFYNPQIEGASSTITINKGASNHFYNVRAESGTTITFASGTSLNSVEESWVITPNSALSLAAVVNDAGTLNRVETSDMKGMHRFPFLSIVPGVPMAVKATQGAAENRFGVEGVFTDTGTTVTTVAWRALIDTGLVPVRRVKSTLGSAYLSAPMFQIQSDASWFRCYAVGYDSAGIKITTQWSNTNNGWTWDGTTDFRWELASANTNLAHMLIDDPNVAFVRILVDSGGTPPPFTRFSIEFLYNDASMTADLAACSTRTMLPSSTGGEGVVTVGTSGSTETLGAGVTQHAITMDQNCTFTFANPSGDGHAFLLLLDGAFSPTWPASVQWTGGTEPVYSSPSEYRFATYDGGTVWLGAQVGAAFA